MKSEPVPYGISINSTKKNENVEFFRKKISLAAGQRPAARKIRKKREKEKGGGRERKGEGSWVVRGFGGLGGLGVAPFSFSFPFPLPFSLPPAKGRRLQEILWNIAYRWLDTRRLHRSRPHDWMLWIRRQKANVNCLNRTDDQHFPDSSSSNHQQFQFVEDLVLRLRSSKLCKDLCK